MLACRYAALCMLLRSMLSETSTFLAAVAAQVEFGSCFSVRGVGLLEAHGDCQTCHTTCAASGVAGQLESHMRCVSHEDLGVHEIRQ